MKKFAKRTALVFGFLVLYVAVTVPLVVLLYTLKMGMGIDIFKHTGFHSYMVCLHQEATNEMRSEYEERRAYEQELLKKAQALEEQEKFNVPATALPQTAE